MMGSDWAWLGFQTQSCYILLIFVVFLVCYIGLLAGARCWLVLPSTESEAALQRTVGTGGTQTKLSQNEPRMTTALQYG